MQRVWASAAVILLLAIGVLVFLLAGAFRAPHPSVLDASPQRLDLIRHAPPSAKSIVLVTAAAGVYRQLQRMPAADAALAPLEESLPFRALPLLIGSGDLVIWREGRTTGYIARPDPARRALIHLFAALSSTPLSTVDGVMLLGKETPSGTTDLLRVQRWVALASGLEGEVFLLQSEADDSGFPPMGRPAATVMRIEPANIRLVSRAPANADRVVSDAVLPGRLPRDAMISVAVARPPAIVFTLAKVFPVDIVRLLGRGGVISVYEIDTGKLIPRLHGVIVVPDDSESREVVGELESGPLRKFPGAIAKMVTERREVDGVEVTRSRGFGYQLDRASRDGALIVSFDKRSMEKYLTDGLEPVPFDAAPSRWQARIRPDLVGLALADLRRQPQWRLLAPDFERALERLRRWTVPLAGSGPIFTRGRSAGALDSVETVIEPPK